MFKWICLGVAVLFLVFLGWMVNDIRLQIRATSEIARTAGKTVNEQLPAIVEKTRKSADTVAEHLPNIVEKTRMSTETLAELAEDIRQLKELAGVANTARDKNLVSYADSVLDFIESSGGSIGLKKTLGDGLKSLVPVKDWVVAARKEALYLSVVARSKEELVTRLSKNKFGSDWQIQFDGQEPVSLLEWLKENHAGTKEL